MCIRDRYSLYILAGLFRQFHAHTRVFKSIAFHYGVFVTGVQSKIGFTDNRIRATVLVQLVYKSLYIIMPDLETVSYTHLRTE